MVTSPLHSHLTLSAPSAHARTIMSGLLAGLVFGGCQGGSVSSADAPNTGLSKLGAGQSSAPTIQKPTTAAAKESAPTVENLSSVFDKAGTPKAATEGKPKSVSAGNVSITKQPASPEPAPESAQPKPVAAPTPKPVPPAERAAVLVHELRGILASDTLGRSSFSAAISNAALDGVSSNPADPQRTDLTPAQTRSLAAVRSFLRALGAGPAANGDPERVTEALERARIELATDNLTISTLALCRRVTGFSRYEPLTTSAFLAGTPFRAILYTELENFAHRRAHDQDSGDTSNSRGAWAVEVTQEITLWASDGSLQWKQAEESLVETGRRKRRDFFLVRQIELPQTLSVGKYTLKVTVRDRTSGASDELTLPLSVVADASGISRSPAPVIAMHD